MSQSYDHHQTYPTFLRALADHLDTHPHLADVNVLWTGTDEIDLQLRGLGSRAAALADWAQSLDIDTIQVRRIAASDHVGAVFILAGVATRVWTALAQLPGVENGAALPVADFIALTNETGDGS